MGLGNLIGSLLGFLMANTNRMACNDAALDPPGIGVSSITRNGRKNSPSLGIAFQFPQIADHGIFHAQLFAHCSGQTAILLVSTGNAPQQPLRDLGGILIVTTQTPGIADGRI
jgi:hypothetical protein